MFSQVLGQERAKEFLQRAIKGARLSHAYLFTGIAGVGKATMGRALAMALNCEEASRDDGCGRCSACRGIMSGNSPDYLCVRRRPEKKDISIEQIRDELNRRIAFPPFPGKTRVCIIHEAETMRREASNSFLKTLEEPPPRNVFVLKAVEPRNLLPTIVSRCQRVAFHPLPHGLIADWLKEHRSLDGETASVVASVSGGSMGRAIDLFDGGFLEIREKWISRIADLPELPKDEAFQAAVTWAADAKTLGVITEPGCFGSLDVLSIWASYYRDLLLLAAGGSERLLTNIDFCTRLQNTAKALSMEPLIQGLLAIDRAHRDLRRMRNVSVVMGRMVIALNRVAARDGETQ